MKTGAIVEMKIAHQVFRVTMESTYTYDPGIMLAMPEAL
jgi:hypothetical protein